MNCFKEKEPEDVSVGRVRFEDALKLGASTQDQAVCQLRCALIEKNRIEYVFPSTNHNNSTFTRITGTLVTSRIDK